MPDTFPENIVVPDADDTDGAEQEPTKRWPWSKPAVQTKPTRKVRREMRRAHRRTQS